MYTTDKLGLYKKTTARQPDVENGLFDEGSSVQDHRRRLSRLDGKALLVRSAAKINLTLSAGPLRSDGYHGFESLMATITLYDDLLIRPGNRRIHLTCDEPTVPVGPDNLVYRACSLLAGHCDLDAGVEIELIKRIPAQAGLGGGSSDAAAALIGLNELWDLGKSREELTRLAGMLGSDVGFFLAGPLAICTGRGEVVEPVEGLEWEFWGVVVKPKVSLSTASVYREFRDSDGHAFGGARELAEKLATCRPSQIAPYLHNDLEAPARRLCGGLGELQTGLEGLLSAKVLLSGSGSAMYCLFDTLDQARSALHRIRSFDRELTCWLVKNNAW